VLQTRPPASQRYCPARQRSTSTATDYEAKRLDTERLAIADFVTFDMGRVNGKKVMSLYGKTH
jgi:hypothetical protein